MSPKVLVETTTRHAMLIAGVIVAIMGFTMISLGWVPHLSIILVLCGLLGLGKLRGLDFESMQEQMTTAVRAGFGAIYLFFFIGLMVTALMMSGAIPTLMYYGFEVISPQFFYVSAFVLTSLIGVAIGSSLTTCATLGVAFIGMSTAFGANPAIVAGAVVSGAFFGDKMSPLSDTCTIAASVVGVDLFDHVRNMSYTTVPAWILSAVLFWWLSGNTISADMNQVMVLKEQLIKSGLVHGYALIPFVVLVGMALRKINAIYTIIATIVVAIVMAYFHSTPTLQQLGGWFFSGYKPAEGLDLGSVGKLVARGGIEGMFFTQTIVILALSLGGLLQALGILPALLRGITHMLTNAGRATFATALTSLGVNVLIGEQYLSLLLAGNTFLPVYERLGLHPRNLARTIEDAGTVINPLVPWSVCGVFISHALGVSVLSYLPYAFFCYFCLFLTLIFGFTGVTISHAEPKPAVAYS
ncbi:MULTISPECIES: Na+/H+ antiporter NhaC [unclassified Moraxella]|uniref:Na+/H+ antiporter NhaC n=1 Tax=unclassified Moraxella TaxID=2685852 RepID=UPI003AF5D4FA